MNNSILAFAVLGGSAAIASAQSPVAPEGELGAAVARQYACQDCSPRADNAVGSGARAARQAKGAVQADAPAIFTSEPDQRPDDRAGLDRADQARHLLGRQTYVGLAGDFGALAFGRQYTLEYLALTNPGDMGLAASATGIAGSGLRRVDSNMQYYGSSARGVSATAAYGTDRFDGSPASRAWGLSVGVDLGPWTIRAAHQNRHVARINLYDLAGNNLEAKNSILAANYRLSWGTAYAAYSINRGWGSSPLFNPDNPYGAGIATTPSTDSRDVLLGVAVPVSRSTTLLASFIHKNDRDLANRDANQLAIGATYAVSRRTDFYAAYTRIQNINGGITVGSAGNQAAGNSAINIGMRHAF
jgi:predicted porin